MGSKLSKEGYLLVDHRESPGISEETAHAAGLPVGAGKGVFEAPTYTCSHCCRVVVLNPLRNRDRAWCWSCDRYICDWCGAAMAASGKCQSIEKIADELLNAASNNKPYILPGV